jgi:hypothetical protein
MVREMTQIHTVWKAENDLHMRAAGDSRERSSRPTISVFRPIAIAPPSYTGDLLVNVGLGCGGSAASNGVEVSREGNLSVVNILIICLEGCRIYLSVIASIDIIESRCP